MHSMTTTVSAGSVTADGGKEGDADGVWINSASITASENMTVDIRGNVSAKTENGASTGVYADVSGENDNSVTVTVGGNVSAEGKGGTVSGIHVDEVTSDEGEASAKIDVKGDVKAVSTDPECRAEGIAIGTVKRDEEKITEMLCRGKTVEEIVDFCGYPDEQVRKISDSLSTTERR